MKRMLAGLGLVLGLGCECSGDNGLSRVFPEIEVSPLMLDFGDVPTGATKHLSVTVKNIGTARLDIANADTTAPFGSKVLAPEIAPGGSAELDVFYTPQGEDPATGTLIIVSNADQNPMVTVSLAGRGIAGFVEISPRSVDFSNTIVGSVRSIEILVQNRGTEAISGQILPERFPRPEHFSLTGLAAFAPGPYGAPPRGDTKLDLEYRPVATGEDSGLIIFETCGARCGVEVEVIASAASASLRLEPPMIEFGLVGIRESKSETVTVHNDGTTPFNVLEIETSGSVEVSARTARPLPQPLAPGSTLVIDVEYTPASAAEMTAELTVRTDDPAVPEAKVRLHGQGTGPLFEYEPKQIEFGVQRRLTTHRRAFLLVNAGSSEVRIDAIEIRGDSVFDLDAIPGLPIRLGAGESVSPYATFSPSGMLGEFTGTIEVRTDDPQSAVVTIPVHAGYAEQVCEMETMPGRVNFGLLSVGQRRDQRVTIRNVGMDRCRFTSGDFAAPLDPAITIIGQPFPFDLGPSETRELSFRYAPTTIAESKVVFEMQTDDPVLPARRISLVGTSVPYTDLFVEPTSIDFGAVRPGCAAPAQTVRLFNPSVIDAVVESAVFTSTSSELSLSPVTPPFTVARGSDWRFTLGFDPIDLGLDRGELVIEVRDRRFPFVIPVRGTGAMATQRTDGFNQRENRAVDVLFVVDDSCSMDDEQRELAANFSSFIRAAAIRSVDFQIGLTTTSVSSFMGGQLVGPVLKPGTPNLEQEFQMQARVGVGGSPFEQGLEAMHLALELADRGVRPNSELIRPNSDLVVILVTDEDDSSPAPVIAYYNDLRSRAGSSFLVAAVTGQATGCFHSGGGEAYPGPKYEDFVAVTNGISLSICANWATNLATIGSAAFGLQISFPLATGADTSQPIEVKIDGVVQPPSSWRYDPAVPAIVFDQGVVPPERSRIEVTYTPAC
jgi:hypothetical protein